MTVLLNGHDITFLVWVVIGFFFLLGIVRSVLEITNLRLKMKLIDRRERHDADR